jgi:hypothetical protein
VLKHLVVFYRKLPGVLKTSNLSNLFSATEATNGTKALHETLEQVAERVQGTLARVVALEKLTASRTDFVGPAAASAGSWADARCCLLSSDPEVDQDWG